ncbi:hypothetical protein PUNSTDRAFT_98407 [Punctularia strigosozonata HHB-11173 SS5]|uniref:uncharacterized protein n=1 Tax=Punctularia strigosozonata (strain HHB-11173) TaxID=741275 RepID=UPI0004418146|nr:uncharacterized protein PUNSTDRAFT_98407 [Punctularia strigosozonata HHB-11173 SS5]EIN11315.1 hypothetical protein PUNSTDRAFT_98407 [Punctularia strigosozonata HHB-11173 SS5]
MPRITTNPYKQAVPDFGRAAHAAVRQLESRGDTLEQAAQSLVDAWRTQNTQEKEAWDRQLREDREAEERAERERQEREEAERAEEEREAAKNRPRAPRYGRDQMVADSDASQVSAYALQRLKQYKFVHLWYFGGEGKREATENAMVASEDVFYMARDGDGVALRLSSSACASKNCKEDKDLDWRLFTIAKAGLLKEMGNVGWSQEVVQDFVDFFHSIETHSIRNEKYGVASLLIYEQEVRQEWHLTYEHNPSKLFNPALFNEERLHRIMLKYLQNQMYEAAKARSTRVRTHAHGKDKDGTYERAIRPRRERLRTRPEFSFWRRRDRPFAVRLMPWMSPPRRARLSVSCALEREDQGLLLA